ncbi:hypothetical protein Goshw_013625 [Gossypium schwendimanii]|uniref:CTLH/CRA C-terminal to LisH motif domain-containing protein n=1 Tax=Gossypium schwendimanii TaxID=34291 RepID=A0A7J9M3N1_GOSSC|nr:hypothetical protein [Gossypium schwendimanii]
MQQSILEVLERTISLLAFEDTSNCPVGELLDISQRLKTASEVNAAVLTSQSHEKGFLFFYLLCSLFIYLWIVDDWLLFDLKLKIILRSSRNSKFWLKYACWITDPKLPSLLKMLIWAQNKLDKKAAYPCINDLSNARLEDPTF